MPQVRITKGTDKVIISQYDNLKTFLLAKNKTAAIKYFDAQNLTSCWVELLHYSMMHKNCPVSALITEQVVIRKILSKEDLIKKVRDIDQEVSLVFSKRVMNYVRSGKFDDELDKLTEVRGTVDKVMKIRAGMGVLNSEAYKLK